MVLKIIIKWPCEPNMVHVSGLIYQAMILRP